MKLKEILICFFGVIVFFSCQTSKKNAIKQLDARLTMLLRLEAEVRKKDEHGVGKLVLERIKRTQDSTISFRDKIDKGLIDIKEAKARAITAHLDKEIYCIIYSDKTLDKKILQGDINFGVDVRTLNKNGEEALKPLIKTLQKSIDSTLVKIEAEKVFKNLEVELRLTVRGYADPTGDSDYNLQLSEDRAKNTLNFIEKSINKANIHGQAFGFGEELAPDLLKQHSDSSRINYSQRRVAFVSGCVWVK